MRTVMECPKWEGEPYPVALMRTFLTEKPREFMSQLGALEREFQKTIQEWMQAFPKKSKKKRPLDGGSLRILELTRSLLDDLKKKAGA